MNVRTIAIPAIEIEQRPDLLGYCEAEQVAGVGAADFLERVEERLGRERLHQALGLGRGENQVTLLARGEAGQELHLFLEGKIQKFRFASYCHTPRNNSRSHPQRIPRSAAGSTKLGPSVAPRRPLRSLPTLQRPY